MSSERSVKDLSGPYIKRLVGAKGFEPSTSWSRTSRRNTILLARLALFCVEQAHFG